MLKDAIFLLFRYLDFYPLFIPLGVIGIWRWSVWLTKKIVGSFYQPLPPGYKASVSVVTPVYNENPQTFFRALTSWAKNQPQQIIAVIDYTDSACIKVFKAFAQGKLFAKLVITKIPGKREALADGIKLAKGEIVALVDSDTIWNHGTLSHGIAPFKDKRIAGVATKQSLEKPSTLAQKLFSIRLELRYWDDFPFLAKSGHQIVCLSGRTAFYRKSVILPFLPDLVNEKFMGAKVISGDDKRLTYLVEAAGWKTTYQSTAQVMTIGETNLSTFIKQQIRWTRNSWRNDLRALYQGWVFKYPVFAFYLIDRTIQPFTLLISPIYFVISLYFRLWIPVFTILIWWLITRSIKMYPHLKKYPGDILLVPVYIIFNFVSAYIRIYTLFSLNTQGWITRWHKSRLAQLATLQSTIHHTATVAIILFVAGGVYLHKYQTFYIPQASQKQLVARVLLQNTSVIAAAGSPAVLGVSDAAIPNLLSQSHEFKATDSLSTLAKAYNISLASLLQVNGSKITNLNNIPPGLVFTIPPPDYRLIPYRKFNYQRLYSDPLRILYDPQSKTVIVSGRGSLINLSDIANSVGPEYLEQVEPGIWNLKANLYLRSGITLKLNPEEVKWLRLTSNKGKFVSILAYNSDIFMKGIKVTSWDETLNDFDTNIADGRSFILVKDGSRMDVVDSEIAYLGYARPPDSPYSSYGISWRMSTGNLGKFFLTGEVINSKFHHNYFGAYTFGATGMTWRGNEFYANIRYGLDPHDDSNGFLVENNVFHHNDSHGLIFSKRCINNVIRNNISYGNKSHGIMLHELSDKNVIENNQIYDNADGIALDHSSQNVIRGNTISNNKRGVRTNKGSLDNLIANNQISGSAQYGVYLYGNSEGNLIQNNTLTNNANALYIKSNHNQALNNILDKNKVGIYFLGQASQNRLAHNKIIYSGSYGVYAKMSTGFLNFVEDNNTIWRNRKDLVAAELP
ncbi:MAG: hypothetical protein A2784_03070 [Candidatus Chisholmbacteria bacterium RIFCSPHIGHO2_01_FULL_48_12]|uniref:LysM domain-containing protein n=1 Tax=Candidatus Chisholmbacteria bacterium RIFCSPHIGHO2_01_FULL_48_12 TaxID=1797589 RepID=A0A1G1VNC4_9BACT|nr:MAG: hypothetical protein A2784_03070 [Candidatus Chisholmbacteria bacterium RIFCSPHIGHO2_01_FULL_48_12]